MWAAQVGGIYSTLLACRRTTAGWRNFPGPLHCLRWLHRTQYGLGRRSIQTAGEHAYPTATLQTALLIRQIGGPRASRLLLCVMPAERTLMHAQMRHRVSPRSCSWHPPWTNEICDLSAPARKIFSAGLPPRTPPGMNSHLSTAVHTWKTHRIWATCLGDPGPLADAHDVGRDPPVRGPSIAWDTAVPSSGYVCGPLIEFTCGSWQGQRLDRCAKPCKDQRGKS